MDQWGRQSIHYQLFVKLFVSLFVKPFAMVLYLVYIIHKAQNILRISFRFDNTVLNFTCYLTNYLISGSPGILTSRTDKMTIPVKPAVKYNGISPSKVKKFWHEWVECHHSIMYIEKTYLNVFGAAYFYLSLCNLSKSIKGISLTSSNKAKFI